MPSPLRTPGSPAEIFRPPVLALGFRVFFLLAGAFAVFVVPLWLLVFWGHVALHNELLGIAWHGHEMVFGFAVAVIAGFLLTAVRNWTGRPTPTGVPLAGLAALWFAGRVVMAVEVPAMWRALIDLTFLPAFAIAIAVPIVRAGSKKNLGIVGLILVLSVTNALFHFDVVQWGVRSVHFAVDLVVLLILIIGGRVIPNFTAGALPEVRIRSSRVVDGCAFGTTAAMAFSEAVLGVGQVSGVFALIAAMLNAYRLAGWQGWKTWHRPILWILHVSYFWIPVGLALRGASALTGWYVGTAPLHALAVGAISGLILGMMTRVSLGHTGRSLQVSSPVVAAYVLVVLAAVLRSVMPLLGPAHYAEWIIASGVAWTLAFIVFVWTHVPILTRPRVDGRPG